MFYFDGSTHFHQLFEDIYKPKKKKKLLFCRFVKAYQSKFIEMKTYFLGFANQYFVLNDLQLTTYLKF